jgi:membrane protease YdiL (CAAX protease family)
VLTTAIYVSVISAFVIVSGIKRVPGIGFLLSIILIGFAFWNQDINLEQMGFSYPDDWTKTILLGLLLGGILNILALTLFEPIIEKITKKPVDVTIVESVGGNWKSLLIFLAFGWVMGGFIEEILFRGFLMVEINKLLGTGNVCLAINVLLTSSIFGIAHWYQGKSGVLITGLLGAFLGAIFVWNEFNLWLPIFVHGFINTFGLIFIATGFDRYVRKSIWGIQDNENETSETP